MKQIIVPKNVESQKALEYDRAADGQLLIWNLTEEEYNHLNSLKIFEIINNKCKVLIDEYEDEKISYEKLRDVISIFDRNDDEVLNKFHQFITETIHRKMSIYFYF